MGVKGLKGLTSLLGFEWILFLAMAYQGETGRATAAGIYGGGKRPAHGYEAAEIDTTSFVDKPKLTPTTSQRFLLRKR
ncbi:unnamed protein product [Prunus armeniaca]|uniref:Uncharacterized protein n=1 Tax=Prunus armeniaca TaxID=36596 RepID=A0A6J5XCC4_PRUAR|nr:unnamed protein product [Prunus armeniaca]